MDHDIRKARIEALELYLRKENANYDRHEAGADAKMHSLFLNWYAEPYMQNSRTKTVALAKRMLAELKGEVESGMSAIETNDVAKLRRVMNRLYDGTVMDFDQRRDLAKIIHGVLDNTEVHGQA